MAFSIEAIKPIQSSSAFLSKKNYGLNTALCTNNVIEHTKNTISEIAGIFKGHKLASAAVAATIGASVVFAKRNFKETAGNTMHTHQG